MSAEEEEEEEKWCHCGGGRGSGDHLIHQVFVRAKRRVLTSLARLEITACGAQSAPRLLELVQPLPLRTGRGGLDVARLIIRGCGDWFQGGCSNRKRRVTGRS